MKLAFALGYILILLTQLPHVWYAYRSLERAGAFPFAWLTSVTPLGAAIAFEVATGIFTYRIIGGSKRHWTRVGLAFFIVASVVANGYYYGWWRWAFDWLMPVFATLALPAALALFAEEFGTEVRTEERRAKRAEREAERPETAQIAEPAPAPSWPCSFPGCGRVYYGPHGQQALAGHAKAHGNGHRKEAVLEEVINHV